MFIQSEQIETAQVREHDVVIVGGGAAGITLASKLGATTGLSVAVLEGGGMAPDDRGFRLYQGKAEGTVLDAENPYLTHTRMRLFGGTTTHWKGWCLPLDPLDFEKRNWIPASGWPIRHTDLEGYYRAARRILKIHAWGYRLDDLTNGDRPQLLPKAKWIETRVLHRSPPVRFGPAYRAEFEKSSSIHVYLQASVVAITADPTGKTVQQVTVRTPGGKEWFARGRQFVLAAGGIENPRLLLASNDVHQNGLGNGSDCVGRYFMEHLEYEKIGKVFFTDASVRHHFYQTAHAPQLKHAILGVLAPNRRAQVAKRLQNCAFFFSNAYSDVPGFRRNLSRYAGRIDCGLESSSIQDQRRYIGDLDLRMEQRPNRESRVMLAEERDELGLPKVHLRWMLDHADLQSAAASLDLLAHEFGACAQGRVRLLLSQASSWSDFRVIGGAHHIGTTRMSEHSRDGVVDCNCLVHGVDNLYIAGSSVFTTAGFSNPTFTIVALALRLADTIKEQI